MFFGLFWRDFLGLFTTRLGPGPVHSPAGPGPIIRVQVHPYLDLDLDIWGLDFGQSMEYSPCKKQFTCINHLDIQISPTPPRSVDSEKPSTVSNNLEGDGTSSLLKSWQRWGFSGVKLTRQYSIKGKRRCWWLFSCMLMIVPAWEHQSTLSTNSKPK